MTFKQKEHLISLLTKLIVSVLYVGYLLSFTDFTFQTDDVQAIAKAGFILFAVQIIAQTVTTMVHALFARKSERIADERDTVIMMRADQFGGYVLGVAMMVGIGLVAFGHDVMALLYSLIGGGLLMGFVADALRIYGYKK